MRKIKQFSISVSLIIIFLCNPKKDGIIQSVTDERGLTSVIYVQSNDTWALDYLTKHELDSLKQTLK